MLHKDYLMRLIEQFTQAMALILGFKKAKNHQKGLATIQNTLQEIFGVDARFLDKIPDEDLLLLLKVNSNGNKTIDPDRALMIAALQKENGDIYEDLNEPEKSYYAYHKCLTLNLEVLLNDCSTIFTGYLTDVELLVAKLVTYDLPWPTKDRLWRYYEKIGDYAKAEDMLYDLIEDEEYPSDIISQGIRFYERLLTKDETLLNAGNLPREEVEEGLANLKRGQFRVADNSDI